MAAPRITNDLMNITVGIKLENGVSARQVRCLIDDFVEGHHCRHSGSDIFGFLWVEDIPDHRRNDFLTAVSNLTPHPDAPPAQARMISASAIW
jgi:hypothetical protein